VTEKNAVEMKEDTSKAGVFNNKREDAQE